MICCSLISPWSGFEVQEGESDPSLPDGDFSVEVDLESQVWPDHDAYIDIPRHIPGPCFFGLEVNTKYRYLHGEMPERKVAFDMASTGKKISRLPHKGDQRCPFVLWIDKA